MKSIIKSLWYFIILLRLGYRLSGNTNVTKNKRWGFVRINHGTNYAIIDIDFDMKNHFSHIHGDCRKAMNINNSWQEICMQNGSIYRHQKDQPRILYPIF